MNSSSRIGLAGILSAYDFSDFKVVVDVAGGQGGLLQGILKRNPAATGILFDSAGVLEKVSIDAAVADRLRKMPGNFFEGVPGGGDAYILRRILHDWDDDKAAEILLRCRQAFRPGAKLLIIEAAPPDQRESGNNWAGIDLLMMLLMDGRERTAADSSNFPGGATSSSRGLFARIHPTGLSRWLVHEGWHALQGRTASVTEGYTHACHIGWD